MDDRRSSQLKAILLEHPGIDALISLPMLPQIGWRATSQGECVVG
jgi:hypothetical protein